MKFTGLAISGALVVSAAASASTLTLTYLGQGHAVSTGIAYNSALSWNGRLAGSYQTVSVGTHRFGIYGQDDYQELKNAFAQTVALYEQHFGAYPGGGSEAQAMRCKDHACHVPTTCACRVEGACK